MEDAAVLVLSELLSNAIQHTEAPPEFEIDTLFVRKPSCLRLEVCDLAPGDLPLVCEPEPEGERGRGLVLVEALTSRWGVDFPTCLGWGKTVWAEMDVKPEVIP